MGLVGEIVGYIWNICCNMAAEYGSIKIKLENGKLFSHETLVNVEPLTN